MKRFIPIFYAFVISALFTNCCTINADCGSTSFCTLQALCKTDCCIAGTFTVDNGQIIITPQDSPFCVQRIDNGLFSVKLKKAFCCPISVVASVNIPNPSGCNVPICSSQNYTFSSPVGGFAVSLDRKCLAVSVGNNTISVFSINPNCTLTFEHTYTVPQGPGPLAYSSNCLVVGSSSVTGSSLSFFNTFSDCLLKEPVQTFKFPSVADPEFFSFSPTGGCLAVTNHDTNQPLVSIFSIEECFPTFITTIGISKDVRQESAIFLSDKCLAVLTGDNNLELYSTDCASPTPILIQTVPIENPTGPMAFSSVNNCLAIPGISNGIGMINVFKVVADNDNCSVEKVSVTPITGKGFIPLFLDYSPNGNCLAVGSINISTKESNISIFSVDSSCGLNQVACSTCNNLGPRVKFLSQDCLLSQSIISGRPSNIITVTKLSSSSNIMVKICEAMTRGCFILQLDLPIGQSDDGITVDFFATQCT